MKLSPDEIEEARALVHGAIARGSIGFAPAPVPRGIRGQGRRRDRGLCKRCGVPSGGKVHCPRCGALKSKQEITRRRNLLAKGFCACNRPLEGESKQCPSCIERSRQREAARRKKGAN